MTRAVADDSEVLHSKHLQLETMGKQWLSTRGQLQVTSLRSGETELGPTTAYVVPTLPLGVDMALGLPLVLRHGCWIGRVANRMAVQLGPIKTVATEESTIVANAARPSAAKTAATEASAADVVSAVIDNCNFAAAFGEGCWNVRWKRKDGIKPHSTSRKVNYKIADEDHR